jgi:hypothetical protein
VCVCVRARVCKMEENWYIQTQLYQYMDSHIVLCCFVLVHVVVHHTGPVCYSATHACGARLKQHCKVHFVVLT